MKTSRIAALSLVAASLGLASIAHADTGLTREQVKAELAQAQRNGDIIDPELGVKLNELFPSAYPAAVKAPKVTITARAAARPTAAPVSGDIEFDAVAQRGVEAMARRAQDTADTQLAGTR